MNEDGADRPLIELHNIQNDGSKQAPNTTAVAAIQEVQNVPSIIADKRSETSNQNQQSHRKVLKGRFRRCIGSFKGWKGGLSLAIKADVLTSLLVLVFLLVTALGTYRDSVEATLFDGDCKTAKIYSVVAHLFINIFSTVLLASSSYAMQLLTSPTRADVTRAHKKGKYLTIGASSLRNLQHFSWSRALLYGLLAATTIPIHLVANSAVYLNQGTNSYLLFAVNYDFDLQSVMGRISATQLNNDLEKGLDPYIPSAVSNDTRNMTSLTAFKGTRSRMEKLALDQCIQTYSQPFIPGYRHVLVVTNQFANISNNRIVGSSILDVEAKIINVATDQGDDDPTAWTCDFDKISNKRICNTENSNPLSLVAPRVGPTMQYPVSYCYGEKVVDNCKLQSNLVVTAIVCLCALSKSVLLYTTLRSLSGNLLATLGDAIASFLETPEALTTECSLLDRLEVKNSWRATLFYRENRSSDKQWQPGQPYAARWRLECLKDRWIKAIPGWTIFPTLAFAIAILSVLLHIIASTWDKSKTIHDTGFGNANLHYIVNLPDLNNATGLITKAVLVNLPQLILSCYYFWYNQCVTYLFLSTEWKRFAITPKHLPLRVSRPQGKQKSNYFLSIPYRLAIPMLICSTVLHWLASQSLFLIRVDVKFGEPFAPDTISKFSAVGYSRTAVTLLLSIFSAHLVLLVMPAIRWRTQSPMPLVGGCSLAISAACHSSESDTECWLKPLKWGIIDGMGKDGFLHCAFTSGDAYSPEQLERRPHQHRGTWTVAYFK